MIKQIVETSLEGELDAYLKSEKENGRANRRNGKSSKRLRTEYGLVGLSTSRDRAGSFEPELVKKREVSLGRGLDDKIILMYSRGMSYDDIRSHLEELYGLEMSKGQLSHITDRVLPIVDEWRTRPLEELYAIVWMPACRMAGMPFITKCGMRGALKAERCTVSWVSTNMA